MGSGIDQFQKVGAQLFAELRAIIDRVSHFSAPAGPLCSQPGSVGLDFDKRSLGNGLRPKLAGARQFLEPVAVLRTTASGLPHSIFPTDSTEIVRAAQPIACFGEFVVESRDELGEIHEVRSRAGLLAGSLSKPAIGAYRVDGWHGIAPRNVPPPRAVSTKDAKSVSLYSILSMPASWQSSWLFS